MKNFLLLCLLACCHFSFAQNWMPFRVGETYNYVSSDTSFVYPRAVSHGSCAVPVGPGVPYYPRFDNQIFYHNNELQIWIDTTILVGFDSVFYFNKKILPCDTCTTPAIFVNQPLGFAILQDSFVKNNLGEYVFYYNNDSLIINPFWALNNSIISDSSAILFAKMAQISFDTLSNYNVWDSIKTFHFYDANNILKYQITLTKTNGINSFQDFATTTQNIQQVGIESKDLGKVQLNWKRIYDFNVGDVFYRQLGTSGPMGFRSMSFLKQQVTNKQIISPDSILYTFVEFGREMTNGWPIGGYFSSQYNVIITKEPSQMQWGHQMENLRDNEPLTGLTDLFGYNNTTGANNNLEIFAKNFLYSDGVEYKYLAYSFDSSFASATPTPWNPLVPINYYVIDSASNLHYLFDNIGSSWVGGFEELYGKGLGRVFSIYTGFEGYGCESLIGYIKNNDTTGTIIPDGVLLGTDNPLTTTIQGINLTLYPNPAQENFTLELDKLPLTDFLQIDVIDLHGRVLLSQQKTPLNSYTISVEGFSNGLYLLQLKDERGEILSLKKFVVQH